jgi:hypothetical protein
MEVRKNGRHGRKNGRHGRMDIRKNGCKKNGWIERYEMNE